jgi:DNA-binding CsgD family transcriptional regulator
MARTILPYAVALALASMALTWLNQHYAIHALPTETYVALVAVGFTALGIWAGAMLTRRPVGGPFQRNEAAIRSLGLSRRECEILDRLAAGRSNKEMARDLGISPNTVKTHIARIYEKLEVQRRVQAIEKARWLALIP